MTLEHDVAIVTGGGRGIGRAISERLAADGACVAVVARTASEIEEVRDHITQSGGRALAIAADVTDCTDVDAMVKRVEEEMGPVTVLVNNAARFYTIGPAWEVDIDEWMGDVGVNVYGVFLCCHEVIPRMIERKKGRIVNLIGGGTATPFPYGSGYGSSKAAVMRFTECLAAELKGHGIPVFALDPGLVRTAMTVFQLENKAGQKWLPFIQNFFDEGVDVPPTRAAGVIAELASGRFDALTGRAFSVGDDLDEVAARIPEILENDEKTLRMR